MLCSFNHYDHRSDSSFATVAITQGAIGAALGLFDVSIVYGCRFGDDGEGDDGDLMVTVHHWRDLTLDDASGLQTSIDKIASGADDSQYIDDLIRCRKPDHSIGLFPETD